LAMSALSAQAPRTLNRGLLEFPGTTLKLCRMTCSRFLALEVCFAS
jgi:hypothetical protein